MTKEEFQKAYQEAAEIGYEDLQAAAEIFDRLIAKQTWICCGVERPIDQRCSCGEKCD